MGETKEIQPDVEVPEEEKIAQDSRGTYTKWAQMIKDAGQEAYDNMSASYW